MNTPQRVQRKRTAGWRMPPHTKYVGRPGKYSNPFFVGQVGDMRGWTGWYVGEIGNDSADHGHYQLQSQALARAVELYRLHTGPMGNCELDVEEVRRDLAGWNLACWCGPDQPCHVDVLLEIANGTAQ
ncbi:DUF4326 domain-containing protein [Micromonospora sp. NPDC007208]|uniref:DUF4326 domain-containing protein n=1 Tax=Micromonospora sp. NPDC007208 TaxID=3364236 RepID=UPI0036A66201